MLVVDTMLAIEADGWTDEEHAAYLEATSSIHMLLKAMRRLGDRRASRWGARE